jgi:acetyl/propionyl-CoA carboxylase alpha subunit
MIQKLLIANRGEIARRIISTAKRLGIGTVAVHSEADARALHVLDADEAVALGAGPARDSYLKIEQIVTAAQQTGADAVHPGYAFLSENPHFARRCREAGLCFVGPSTAVIEAMGSKVAARDTAVEADVPVVPGSGPLGSCEQAVAEAARLGYPLLLKPASGGAGVGVLKVLEPSQLPAVYDAVRFRAEHLLDDDTVYLERYLERPRHVEVQIAGDTHGNVVHLGERECSLQRRCQKLLEETPSPALNEGQRARMTEAALRIAHRVGYCSLGTVEFLLAGSDFYFLEMSTRLQIEHTVTEMVTGLDLVEWQVRIALGEDLPARQDEIDASGHAIQCRIYAEDPAADFAPCPGRITAFDVPTGPWVRNDVAVGEGDTVTPYYDPMIGKLIVPCTDGSCRTKRSSEESCAPPSSRSIPSCGCGDARRAAVSR